MRSSASSRSTGPNGRSRRSRPSPRRKPTSCGRAKSSRSRPGSLSPGRSSSSRRVNEASLTGESLPVSKTVEPLPRDAFLGDRRNMVFMGTTVDGGLGKAVVVETGMGTELGKIAGLVQQEAKEETPLQRQLDRLGRQIGIAVLAAAGLIFLIGILREPDPSHIELLFLTAVGLAVAAIPEGLPAI